MSRTHYFRSMVAGDRMHVVGVDVPRGGLRSGDVLTVEVADPGQAAWEAPESVVFRVESIDRSCLRIRLPSTMLALRFEEETVLQSFLARCEGAFVDMLLASVICRQTEDYLWIEPDLQGCFWVLAVCFGGSAPYSALVRRGPIDAEDLLTAFSDHAETYGDPTRYAPRRFAEAGYRFLKDGLGLPEDFPLFTGSPDAVRDRRLTVRAPRSERWPLLIPFDEFSRHGGLGGFVAYQSVSWITTGKSFVQNAIESMHLSVVFDDPVSFLPNAVFIINDYDEFYLHEPDAGTVREATRLALDVLSLFEEIRVSGGEVIRLRYHYNPSAATTIGVLRDLRTRYLIANFHTESGRWKVGGCTAGASRPDVLLDGLPAGVLSHIRLMRVYHCQSIGLLGLGGAGPSLVDTLLDLGALRVDGSPMQEDYLDFLHAVLQILCGGRNMSASYTVMSASVATIPRTWCSVWKRSSVRVRFSLEPPDPDFATWCIPGGRRAVVAGAREAAAHRRGGFSVCLI